ncbi:MAG: Ig-like domain-containing protein [bacterium]
MDKKLLGLVLLFIASFVFFITILFFNEPLSKLTRAKEDTVPSPQKSLIFAWPLTVKSDGKDISQINVFIRNNNNKLIADKKVELRSSLGDVKNVTTLSDTNGKTSFQLTSTTPGTTEITAVADGIKLDSKITVKFIE